MNVLMLGGPNTGKSTFLVQLYGRMEARRGKLAIRNTPDDLTPIRDGLQRIAAGIPLEHTQASAKHLVQRLPAITEGGRVIDIQIPEYAGESLDEWVRGHRVPDSWRPLVEGSGQWLLFVRLEQFPDLPELLRRPMNEPDADLVAPETRCGLGSGGAQSQPGTPKSADDEAVKTVASEVNLPLDMHLVELLQLLTHERGSRPRGNVPEPFLTVTLSCWDEIGLQGKPRPETIAAKKIPLLHSFVRTNWACNAVNFVGLSSQGRKLMIEKPDNDFAELGPEHRGYIVTEDGAHDPDLTRIVRIP